MSLVLCLNLSITLGSLYVDSSKLHEIQLTKEQRALKYTTKRKRSQRPDPTGTIQQTFFLAWSATVWPVKQQHNRFNWKRVFKASSDRIKYAAKHDGKSFVLQ